MNALAKLVELISPRDWWREDCFLCGQTSSEGVLCAGCQEELPVLSPSRCPACALPTPAGELCGACLNHPPHFDATLAAFEYRFPLEPMVIALKYHAQLPIADFLVGLMTQMIERPRADAIVPLPLHPKRIVERGFNQSAELARRLAKHWRIPLVLGACERDRHTEAQAKLPGTDRHQNVKGAFRATRDFSGQHVLVVDDVMTTGSTLDEVARVLKNRGAARVTNVVAARTLPHFGSKQRG